MQRLVQEGLNPGGPATLHSCVAKGGRHQVGQEAARAGHGGLQEAREGGHELHSLRERLEDRGGCHGRPPRRGRLRAARAAGAHQGHRDLGNKDLPSAGETPELKGADFFFWTGLFAPKGTPAPIVSKLNLAFAEVLKEQKVKSRFAELGVKISDPANPQAFGAFVAQSSAQYEQLVKQSNAPRN